LDAGILFKDETVNTDLVYNHWLSRTIMANYPSVRQLVIDAYANEGEVPSYEKLTKLVLENFPSSKWQRSHYDWYKSQILRGKIEVPGMFHELDLEDEAYESIIEHAIEASLSVEKDLHSYLATHVRQIEEGLAVVEDGIEYSTKAGRIDILAKDTAGRLVVIELKAGKASDATLGQLLGYVGCVSEVEAQRNVRGILVAADFDKRVIYAARCLSNISLVKYQVTFKFNEIQ
jgi:endonuclease